MTLDHPAPAIDWFQVIVDIERTGLSQADIGARVGVSQAQVNNYKNIPATEPRHSVGQVLLGLWQERCLDPLAHAPTLR